MHEAHRIANPTSHDATFWLLARSCRGIRLVGRFRPRVFQLICSSGGDITMPLDVNEVIRKLNPADRKKVEDRAAEIVAEEMSLRDLRKARKLTQARVVKALGITQDSVSRLEKRSDLLISILRKTVKAMGGDVRIVAEFPDRTPVVLSELFEDVPQRV